MATETRGRENEDDGVHDRLEEHDDDGAVDTGRTLDSTDEDTDDGASNGVDTKEDGSSNV